MSDDEREEPEEPEDPVEREDAETDEPQPWAKALPGDDDENASEPRPPA